MLPRFAERFRTARPALASIALLVAILALAPGRVLADTSLRIASDPGDPIGQGSEFYITDGLATFTIDEVNGVVHATVDPAGPGDVWNFAFQPPDGEPLEPGPYSGAIPVPASGGSPGLTVGTTSVSCSSMSGSFELRQFERDAFGNIVAFRVFFEQHCDGQAPALRGELAWQATVPVKVDAPLIVRAPRGEMAVFFAFVFDPNWSPGSFSATGVPAGADFTDYGDNSAGFFWPTTLDDVGRARMTVTGTVGATSETVPVALEVLGDSRLLVSGEAGEPLTGGASLDRRNMHGQFTATRSSGRLSVDYLDWFGDAWTVALEAPDGGPLAEGWSGPAASSDLAGPGVARLDIERNGVPASGSGSARVHELTFDADGYLLSYRASFELAPDGGPALAGDIWHNATAVVSIHAPAYRAATAGEPIEFAVSADDLRGGSVALSAAGLPAGATFDGAGNASGAFAWTPPADFAGTVTVSWSAVAPDGRSDQSTTTLVVTGAGGGDPPLAARAHLTAANRDLKLFSTRPWFAVQLEPVDGSFALADIDAASIELVSVGTGSVERAPCLLSTTGPDRDTDRNGVLEWQVGFDMAALRPLFDGLATSPAAVPVALEGALAGGGTFRAEFELVVATRGGPPLKTKADDSGRVLTIETGEGSRVSVRLFDAAGRLVASPFDADLPAGTYELSLEAVRERLASGVYFYRAEAGEAAATGRIVIRR
jgi:hypothetical protein